MNGSFCWVDHPLITVFILFTFVSLAISNHLNNWTNIGREIKISVSRSISAFLNFNYLLFNLYGQYIAKDDNNVELQFSENF